MSNTLTQHPQYRAARAAWQEGDLDTAEEACRAVLDEDAGHADALHLLSQIALATGHAEPAFAILGDALHQRPAEPAYLETLAAILQALGRIDEAAQAHYIRANELRGQGRLEEAVAAFRDTLAVKPGDSVARFALASLLLLTERFAEGWEHFEARTAASGHQPRFPGHDWAGEDITGKTLFVTMEEGMGDFVQFCRFIPMAAQRAGRVIVEVPEVMRRLAQTLPGVSQIVAFGAPSPAFDVHCRVMSLPRALGIVAETVPASVPYLAASPQDIAAWQARLAATPGRKVGLAWAGNRKYAQDAVRSIDPALFAPLGGIEAVSFVSLQRETLERPPFPIQDWTYRFHDLSETAALMECLDLVISVDTVVAHLAGALGRPVWLLNRFQTDWRWGQARADSRWYPSMRIFRQAVSGDWTGPITAVAAALREPDWHGAKRPGW